MSEESTTPEAKEVNLNEETPKNFVYNGRINFTITESPDGMWQVNYERGAENEIATLAISQYVMGLIIGKIDAERPTARGKEKQLMGDRRSKFISARMALEMANNFLIGVYKEHKRKEKVAAEDGAKILSMEVKEITEEVPSITTDNMQPLVDMVKPPITEENESPE